MNTLVSDLRYSVRNLFKSPGFSLVAIIVLAVGIGLNTAIFSLVNTLILRPLPGDRLPGQLVGLYGADRTRPDTYREFSYPNYVDIRDRNGVFSQIGAMTVTTVGIGEGELTRRLFAFVVTSNFFSLFGTQPAMGRVFLPEEERPGAMRPVAILSYEFWQKNGADPAVVNSTIRINTRPFTVVGVAPKGFGGPTTMISPAVWLPTGVYEMISSDVFRQGSHTALDDRANETLIVFGRLKPGTTVASADSPLKALSRQMEEAFPGENKNLLLLARRLGRTGISSSPQTDTDSLTASALLMAMAAVVLIIACMNLANMLLARGSARRREIAIRLSMGANRGRIVRQLLTEGFVLSLVGGAAGLMLTFWGLRSFAVSINPALPLLITIDAVPDVRVLAVTFGLALFSTLAFGLGPAWKLARTDVITEMKEGDRSGPRGRARRFGFRHALAVGQIALSLALLTAAGLFVRGALNVRRAEPGFSLDRTILATLDPSLAGMDEARTRALYLRLMERVRALPGVKAASFASIVPFGDYTEERRLRRVGDQPASGAATDTGDMSYGATNSGPSDNATGIGANYYIVGRDYFQTLGIPILRGRGFTEAEEQGASGPPVAVIDEPLARKLFKGADPLGQQVYFPSKDPSEARPFEIVGVVRGTRHSLFDHEAVAHVFMPFGQRFRSSMSLEVRTTAGGSEPDAAMLAAVRREIRAVDERLPIIGLMTMREHRDTGMASWMVRTNANLFSLFGGLAALLAVVGVYGVRAYLVSRRSREIGIRMALGANTNDVVWMILREGLVLVAAGVAIGVLLAAGVGRLVASLLYEVSAFDPLVFVGASILLAFAALVACYVPARRATKVTPVTALRME